MTAKAKTLAAAKMISVLPVVRGGDIVGEHRLIFAGAGEQVELTHRSISRDTYAAGAVRAAKWAAKAKAGFYDMTPVLAEVKKQ